MYLCLQVLKSVTSIYICSQDVEELSGDLEDLRNNLLTLSEAKEKIIKATKSRASYASGCPGFVILVEQCKYIYIHKFTYILNFYFCSNKIKTFNGN